MLFASSFLCQIDSLGFYRFRGCIDLTNARTPQSVPRCDHWERLLETNDHGAQGRLPFHKALIRTHGFSLINWQQQVKHQEREREREGERITNKMCESNKCQRNEVNTLSSMLDLEMCVFGLLWMNCVNEHAYGLSECERFVDAVHYTPSSKSLIRHAALVLSVKHNCFIDH